MCVRCFLAVNLVFQEGLELDEAPFTRYVFVGFVSQLHVDSVLVDVNVHRSLSFDLADDGQSSPNSSAAADSFELLNIAQNPPVKCDSCLANSRNRFLLVNHLVRTRLPKDVTST